MKVVTAANKEYFPFLTEQIQACAENLNKYPYVFDLGLTENQRFMLKGMGVPVLNKPPAPRPGKDYPGGYKPRALFKPAMLHVFCEMHDDDVLYLDADAMPVAPFEFPCDGLGLTPVGEQKMMAYWGTPLYEYVGPYHSGVIFLGKGERLGFLKRWALDMWRDPLPSDKKSLNRAVKNERVHELDSDIWNARVMYPDTKIFHYQGPIARPK